MIRRSQAEQGMMLLLHARKKFDEWLEARQRAGRDPLDGEPKDDLLVDQLSEELVALSEQVRSLLNEAGLVNTFDLLGRRHTIFSKRDLYLHVEMARSVVVVLDAGLEFYKGIALAPQRAPVESVRVGEKQKRLEEKNAQRSRVLDAIYELTEGDTRAFTTYAEVNELAGLSDDDGDAVTQVLGQKGLVNRTAGYVSLTPAGVEEHERALGNQRSQTSHGPGAAARQGDKPHAPGDGDTSTDFVILTAIEVERKAVCSAMGFGDMDRVRKGSRVYWRGRLPLADGRFYDVVVAQSADMANVDMAILTNDTIHHWSPQAALLAGIAATTDSSVKLGDIVIGADVYYYERGKQTPGGSKPEPKIISPDATLWSNVNALPEWDGRVAVDRPDGTGAAPTVHRGVIASGEKVIADAAMRDTIAAAHRKVVAIEMEGYGFSRAVWQSFEHVRHLVLRSVCDDGSPTKDDSWHKYAAAAAAAYTRHFLRDGPLPPRAQPASVGSGRAIGTPAPTSPEGLTTAEKRVLGVFAEFRIGAHEYLPDGSFQTRADKFPPPLRDRAFDILASMHERGLLGRTEHGYTLTEEGARLLYGDEAG